MREGIQKILLEYKIEREKPFVKNHLADFIRKDLREDIKKIINDENRYLVTTSPGKGVWTSTPWMAIFDLFVTETAQKGFYPVFIFKEDMSGVYLTLNQGVTFIRNEYKKSTTEVLRMNADDFRARIGQIPKNFSEIDIILSNENSRKNLARDYEAGNIIAKFYSSSNLPSNNIFEQDIKEILTIYKSLIFSHNKLDFTEEENSNLTGIEKKQYSQHRRIERNQSLIRKVKKVQGCTCKACGLFFTDKYGELGKDFIEAHHLKMISTLTEEITELDALKDFTVLCSNCHRMIHRTNNTSDLEAFKLLLIN